MRTTAFIQALLASLVLSLSACASDGTFDPSPRAAAPAGFWRARTLALIPSQAAPVVDTTAQREALRRVPHGADRLNGASSHR